MIAINRSTRNLIDRLQGAYCAVLQAEKINLEHQKKLLQGFFDLIRG